MGLSAAVWYGSGEELPVGCAGQLDSNGGMRVAWVWRLHKTYKTYKTYKIMVGRRVIPRGFACAAVWVASECRFTVG